MNCAPPPISSHPFLLINPTPCHPPSIISSQHADTHQARDGRVLPEAPFEALVLRPALRHLEALRLDSQKASASGRAPTQPPKQGIVHKIALVFVCFWWILA